MNINEEELRHALQKIADIAGQTAQRLGRPREYRGDGRDQAGMRLDCGCTLRQLPERLQLKAARVATRINPANAVNMSAMASFKLGVDVMDPLSISVLTSKYWGPQVRQLTVSFMENTQEDLRTRIVEHLNAWNRTAGISFASTRGTGQVRISLGGGGYWSYLGTDILHIPPDRQTMNLEGFTMNTPDSEFRRVIRHEAGHTLGFPHEHMRKELIARVDPQRAYDYFWRTQGWDRKMVDAQVLTSLDDRTLMSTPPDEDSIMCYQLPGSITRDGEPIRGGTDINDTDAAFAARLYPKRSGAPGNGAHDDDHETHEGVHSHIGDWDRSDDVEPDLSFIR